MVAMRPKQLRHRIKQLDADTPRYGELELALQEGVGFGGAWYSSQKEHWMGWLGEYDGPGAYGRASIPRRDARFVYNHIQCAPMLFWLAEAVHVPSDDLDCAFEAVVTAPKRNASQCAALRRLLPWENVCEKLIDRTHGAFWCRFRMNSTR